nr:MAG TPA: PROTEIN/RNA Complex, Sec61, translocation, translation, eEF2 [Caudoviricetes sp.]
MNYLIYDLDTSLNCPFCMQSILAARNRVNN